MNVNRPCTVDDGITEIPEPEVDELTLRFDEAALAGRVAKFVPASGAATRMFEALLAIYKGEDGQEDPKKWLQYQKEYSKFIGEIKKFAFFDDLNTVLRKDGFVLKTLLLSDPHHTILKYLLSSKGLNYANLPKGLIIFHRYLDHTTRTPIEEHLVEASEYARDSNNVVRVHFTISPEHRDCVVRHVEQFKQRHKQNDLKFDVTYFEQKASTDTIAVDLSNMPFRDRKGNLLLRPAGHGVLIESLSDFGGDIVVLKNVDNVLPERPEGETYRHVKALGGHLLKAQKTLFTYLTQLEETEVEDLKIDQMFEWAKRVLMTRVSEEIVQGSPAEQVKFLQKLFNRPTRVCGMVENTGEPGGGPFWVESTNGTSHLQIVESSQLSKEQRTAFLKKTTHFNPVVIVCGVRDYRHTAFDLKQFIDPKAEFIATKKHENSDIKALERPGLWNGGMAYWNTIFIQIPPMTFNPVKTVLDLLRPGHQ